MIPILVSSSANSSSLPDSRSPCSCGVNRGSGNQCEPQIRSNGPRPLFLSPGTEIEAGTPVRNVHPYKALASASKRSKRPFA